MKLPQSVLDLSLSLEEGKRKLSEKPGIYIFYDKFGKALYVGKAKNLKKRVFSYFLNRNFLDYKTSTLVNQTARISTIEVNNEIESFLLEAKFIKKLVPVFNIKLKDAKTYPLVQVTVKEKFPKVLITRKTGNKNSIYFGPFPNVGELRAVLRYIRKIFPYQSVKNHVPNRICLYHHLELCPCPVTLDTRKKIQDYKKNIKYIIQFLRGEQKSVLKDLEKKRNDLSKKEEYEKAKEIQSKINEVKNITEPIRTPQEYELNPNLREDLRKRELNELRTALDNFGIKLPELGRIECFDISNISGKDAVGSMIVFTNGESNKSQYRRFKIRRTNGSNDPAMMAEVFERRFNHKEWEYPDLIILDGGKGQISEVLKIKQNLNILIPVIGLAKRNETIIAEDFRELNLPRDSKAMHLIQRIRDEAHRFAITYHKKLRSKFIQS